MAAYMGEKYIGEQIASILDQFGPDDELIVVDDASPDRSAAIVAAFGDGRIRLIPSATNRGYVRAFETAVRASRGQYVFLADQDDIWLPGRLDRMIAALGTASVVATNYTLLGDRPRTGPLLRSRDSVHHVRNLLGILVGYRPYFGCGMAMRRSAVPRFVPIPPYVRESHDLWLAISANVAGDLAHLDEPTLARRIHGGNATPEGWRSLSKILKARVMFVRLIAEARRRERAARARPAAV
jgi:glycosyltransferase involved in cell wall biosynthesis